MKSPSSRGDAPIDRIVSSSMRVLTSSATAYRHKHMAQRDRDV
jgi:hypothetical protein